MSVVIGASSIQRQEKTYAVASCGKQIAANWIDFAVLVVAASTTHLLSHDAILTVIVSVELVLTMMIWEGARGETVGKLITGTRTVREECVMTRTGGVLPAGMLLIAKKYGMLLLCACAVGVGLIAEMCSSAFSSKAAVRRDWADGIASLVQVDIDRPLLLNISTVGSPLDSSFDVLFTSRTQTDAVPEPRMVPEQPSRSPSGEWHSERIEPPAAPAPNIETLPSAPAVPVPQPLAVPAPGTSVSVAEVSTPVPAPAPAPVPAPVASTPAMPARTPRRQERMRHAVPRPEVDLPARPSAAQHQQRPLSGGIHVDLPQRPVVDTVQERAFIMYLEDGTRIGLPTHGAIVVGRKPTAVEDGDGTVTVKDTTGTMSRSHARIEINDGTIWITDLGSLNGTSITIDGEERRLQRDHREHVEPGARLSFGDMTGSIMETARRRSA
ncbi:FHA domain-containing protein [Bifidobacterium criceti]|uniref:Signal peptide protein n=1 Tax=Bifidobacterium criceti TaxID=1960969 RepID=A0A2A2EIZ9_9BIFI|nr:FHA domain-containing protein [Bifidobacterium criceti]PAU68905.1 signal peptide protein [Bifidobacterium criceti]